MKEFKKSSSKGLTRRGFLGAVGGSVGLAGLFTAGQTVPGLEKLAILAPRTPSAGSQGLPVNKTAEVAKVTQSAVASTYTLQVVGSSGKVISYTLSDLQKMPQTQVDLPIACVEGWSAMASWKGVRLNYLLKQSGNLAGNGCVVKSLEERGPYNQSYVDPAHTADDMTVLALQVNGETLNLDHGYPVRLISPSRPGVMQTKWLKEIRVL